MALKNLKVSIDQNYLSISNNVDDCQSVSKFQQDNFEANT